MEVNTRDGLRISGKVKIDTYRAGMVNLVIPYLDLIRAHKKAVAELPPDSSAFFKDYLQKRIIELKAVVEDIKHASFIRTAVECPNLVMDSPNYGLDLIIQRLVGNNTYSLNLQWIEIGTGTTTPTVNDTGLASPSLRLPISFQEDYGATDAIVQAYVTDANLPNATYGEVGSFVDGSSSIGSGQLFNHALISPTYAKVSGQDTTIEIDLTIVNS
jgi:hypothetical protein